MIITAKFIGKSSLGYETGKEYWLKVANFGYATDVAIMSIRRMDNTGVCPYHTLSTFLDNWTNVCKELSDGN